jgi:hypothetical protein
MSEKLNVFSEFEGNIDEIQSHLDTVSISDETNAVICSSSDIYDSRMTIIGIHDDRQLAQSEADTLQTKYGFEDYNDYDSSVESYSVKTVVLRGITRILVAREIWSPIDKKGRILAGIRLERSRKLAENDDIQGQIERIKAGENDNPESPFAVIHADCDGRFGVNNYDLESFDITEVEAIAQARKLDEELGYSIPHGDVADNNSYFAQQIVNQAVKYALESTADYTLK